MLRHASTEWSRIKYFDCIAGSPEIVACQGQVECCFRAGRDNNLVVRIVRSQRPASQELAVRVGQTQLQPWRGHRHSSVIAQRDGKCKSILAGGARECAAFDGHVPDSVQRANGAGC